MFSVCVCAHACVCACAHFEPSDVCLVLASCSSKRWSCGSYSLTRPLAVQASGHFDAWDMPEMVDSALQQAKKEAELRELAMRARSERAGGLASRMDTGVAAAPAAAAAGCHGKIDPGLYARAEDCISLTVGPVWVIWGPSILISFW
eukprot:scaffold45922_cov22-Tisochrysis_lutea.AAC.4